MKTNRPILVTYIVDLNFLNIFILLVTMFPKLMKRLGIITPTPTLANVSTRVIAILILISISYGLLRLKKWGFWLMVGYNAFFLILSIVFIFYHTKQYYNPGMIISIMGLSLSLSAKRYFVKEKKPS